MGGSGWAIVEDSSYTLAVAQAGGYPLLDQALAPLDYAFHRNPLGFPVVPGFPEIHLAKTSIRIFGSEIIPSFRVWIRVDSGARMVHKLWVEIAPPEDMGFWDDDDNPFTS
jgi:hypothetical protein